MATSPKQYLTIEDFLRQADNLSRLYTGADTYFANDVNTYIPIQLPGMVSSSIVPTPQISAQAEPAAPTSNPYMALIPQLAQTPQMAEQTQQPTQSARVPTGSVLGMTGAPQLPQNFGEYIQKNPDLYQKTRQQVEKMKKNVQGSDYQYKADPRIFDFDPYDPSLPISAEKRYQLSRKQSEEATKVDDQRLADKQKILSDAKAAIASGNMKEAQILISAYESLLSSDNRTVAARNSIMGTNPLTASDRNAPSSGFEDTALEQPKQPTNYIADLIDQYQPTGNYDFGLSEILRGKPNEAKNKLSKTIGSMLPEFTKSAYASSDFPTQQPQQPNQIPNTLSKIGGLSSQVPASMQYQPMIGKVSGGSIASNAGIPPSLNKSGTQVDNRDTFFKAGGAEMFKDYLKPGVDSAYRGALDTTLFSSDFFKDPERVGMTFGNTHLAKDATAKYKTELSKDFPILPGGENPKITKTVNEVYKQPGYINNWDGLYIDDMYWKDAFMKQGKDVNSSEGKSYQDREKRQTTPEQNIPWSWTYEEDNPIYLQNQYNKSVLDAVPEALQSAYQFVAPVVSKAAGSAKNIFGGLVTNVFGTKQSDEIPRRKDAPMSTAPQAPISRMQISSTPPLYTPPTPYISTQVAKSQYIAPISYQERYGSPPVASVVPGAGSFSSSNLGGAPTPGSTPAPKPAPKPAAPVQSAPAARPSSAPTPAPTPAARPSAPAPAPAPKPVAPAARPSYTPTPAPTPRAPTPAPKPAPKPAAPAKSATSQNVFQKALNTILSFFR